MIKKNKNKYKNLWTTSLNINFVHVFAFQHSEEW